MNSVTAAFAAGVVIAGAALLALRLPVPDTLAGDAGYATTPRPLPPLALERATGGTFSNSDLEGQWTLVASGYTHCPDICPTTLATLAAVEDAVPVQVLFVTMDPARDRGTAFSDWVRWFSPTAVAATGTPTALDRFSAAFGFTGPGRTTINGSVAHAAAVALVGPDGHLHGRYHPPLDGAAIAAHLRHLRQPPG